MRNRRIAAVARQHRSGETFPAVVPGVTPQDVFVRLRDRPAEALRTHGQQGLDGGDQIQVKLASTDPQRGWIDFAR